MSEILKTTRYTPDQQEILCCPICGFDYIHPVAVKVATEEDLTRIDQKGISIQRNLKVLKKSGERFEPVPTIAECMDASSERGVRIFIEYTCENGHHGQIIFQFHKGNLYVSHEPLDSTDNISGVIWRS